MNHFISPTSTADTKVPRHLETLATTIFQSLFPPINPQKTPLKSIKRVLLLNREHGTEQDDGSFIVNFRHYAITTRAAGVSRAVRRLRAAERLAAQTSKKAAVPNLGRLEDIADYMIGDGYATDATSGSELDTDNEIEVLEPAKRRAPKASEASALAAALQDAADDDDEDAASGAAADQVERRAVKLVELGPRMRLRLTKVEDGMCAGGIMWHEYVHKSPAEVKELEKRWEKRRLEKEARKKEQRANVERKKREREEAREKSKGGRGGGGGGEGEGGEMDVDDDDEEDEYVSDSDFDEVAAAAQGEGEDDMETNE
jgi:ribosome biogenesis protein SSF1/2